MSKQLFQICLIFVFAAAVGQAGVITIPQSALVPSTVYYTDLIGGGIGSVILDRNDDDYTGPISLGFALNFYGNTYTEFWVNNNGNISFNDGISSYTPSGPQGAPEPIISPFFADVDTRNPASGLVYLRNDIPGQVIVTWDAVGYYRSHADLLNSFQLVLRGPGYSVPPGEGQIGFFYKTMQWETGDASGGEGGFGGTPAAVGFGDGQSNGFILAGSTQDGISGVVSNHHIWFNLSSEGVPETGNAIPEPSTLLMLGTGLLLVAAGWKKAARARG